MIHYCLLDIQIVTYSPPFFFCIYLPKKASFFYCPIRPLVPNYSHLFIYLLSPTFFTSLPYVKEYSLHFSEQITNIQQFTFSGMYRWINQIGQRKAHETSTLPTKNYSQLRKTQKKIGCNGFCREDIHEWDNNPWKKKRQGIWRRVLTGIWEDLTEGNGKIIVAIK